MHALKQIVILYLSKWDMISKGYVLFSISNAYKIELTICITNKWQEWHIIYKFNYKASGVLSFRRYLYL